MMRLQTRFVIATLTPLLLIAMLAAVGHYFLALQTLKEGRYAQLEQLRAAIQTSEPGGAAAEQWRRMRQRLPQLVYDSWPADEGANRLAGQWPGVQHHLNQGTSRWQGELMLNQQSLLAVVFHVARENGGVYQLLGFARAPLWRSALIQMALPMALTLAALGLFWLIATHLIKHQVVQPLRQLRRGLERICDGEYPDHIHIKGGEEFSLIGMRILRLSDRIAQELAQRARVLHKEQQEALRQQGLVRLLETTLDARDLTQQLQLVSEEVRQLIAPQQLMAFRVNEFAYQSPRFEIDPEALLPAIDEPEDQLWTFCEGGRHLCLYLCYEEQRIGTLQLLVSDGESLPDEPLIRTIAHLVAVMLQREAQRTSLQLSEAKLRTLFDQVADGILVLDERGRIVRANEAVLRLSGYRRDQLLGMAHEKILLQAERAVDRVAPNAALCLVQRQGKRLPVELSRGCFEEGGQQRTVLSIRDLSHRLRTEQSLRLLSQVVEQSPVAVVITDLEGVIEYVNKRFCDDSGYRPMELIGQHSRMMQSGLTPKDQYREMWGRLCQGKAWRGELCNRTKSGALIWERMLISPVKTSGRPSHFMALKENITREREREQKLFEQSQFDRLTGLPNRTQAMDALEARVEQPDASAHLLLVLDVDRFREVNESLGHGAGDQLLVAISERLQAQLPAGAMLARLGGDEFALIAPLGERSPEWFAAQLRTPFKQPLSVDDRPVFVSFSIGIACWPDDSGDAMSLLRKAEAALNLAKRGGRGRTERYRDSLQQGADDRLVMETALQFAMDRNEFVLHYQPQVASNGRVKGAEAVLRWENPDLGPISPEIFVPMAEALGLIDALGEWTLWQACRDALSWQGDPRMPDFVAVNLSAGQLKPGFVRRVSEILAETGLPAAALELEITESLLLDRGEQTLSVLEGVHELGVRLALDDFGTGYSSLSYLQKYPFDTLKIDRSFIEELELRPESQQLVRAIVSMAQSLSLQLVAEGVETDKQLSFVRQLGCELVQGYYYAPPQPLARLRATLEAHSARF